MSPDRPDRILLVRPSHLGDIVCALPVFHALRHAAPEAELGWVVQPEFAGLLSGLPGLDRVIRLERRRGAAGWLALARRLRAFDADVAVDAQGNLKSAGAVWLSRAPRRIGLAREDWREPAGARVLNEPAPPAPEGAHAVERSTALAAFAARALGSEPPPPRTDPALTDAELARGRELARLHLPRADGAPVIVHVAAPQDVRAWPTLHYGELALRLLAAGHGVLILSGPAEAPIGEYFREKLGTRPGLRHWIGQSHLREACAFLAAAAERGARMVATDSGPLHLAAASGLPVVALAGPQDPARTGPWPPPASRPDSPHRVATAPDPPACAPCLSRSCTHPRGPVCMAELPPAHVHALLET